MKPKIPTFVILLLILTACSNTQTIGYSRNSIQPADLDAQISELASLFNPSNPTQSELFDPFSTTTPTITTHMVGEIPESRLQEPTLTRITNVPFTPQAPFAEWDEPIFQEACEEAASLMAIYWAKGTKSITKQQARQEIINISDYQLENYNQHLDTSAQDTADRIIKDYFKYDQVEVKNNITIQDIIDQISQGRLVIVPTNGQKLGNPFYKPPGPERHNLVITGYDPQTDQFITHDPGTRRGEGYKYDQQTLFDAIRDYPTGFHEPIQDIEKTMIVVKK